MYRSNSCVPVKTHFKMIIYSPCPKCKSKVSVKSNVAAPQELLQKRGETFNVNCDKCSSTFQAESMHTRAKTSTLKVLFGLAGSVVLGLVIWDMGYIAGIALAPVSIIYSLEEKSVSAYNSLSKRKYG